MAFRRVRRTLALPAGLLAVLAVVPVVGAPALRAQAAPASAPPAPPAQPAQAPERYPAVAQALAAADTVAALLMLQRYGNAGDPEAWYRRGVLASNSLVQSYVRPRLLTDPGVVNGPMWVTVEESLEAATRLAPDSARYWLRLARHQLWFRSGAAHHAGYVSVDEALGAAHRVGGREAFALAAYDAAMLFWRQWQYYDGRSDASLAHWERAALASDDSAVVPVARRYRVSSARTARLGSQELAQAEILLGLAADSAPSIQLVRRRRYAALAGMMAWEELRGRVGARLRDPTADFVDLLALGLARHRLADAPGADSAFAAARRAMPDDERRRLTSIQRILPREERAAFGILRPDARERVEERAWLLMDPLWRVPGNEIRSEFMTRVAYAELRWGTGFPGTGVDSDPGTVWIAYGPPLISFASSADGRGPAIGTAYLTWRWSATAQVQFRVTRDLVDETLLPGMRARFEELVAREGVNWRGVPGVSGLDTIAVQSALFRAGPDSADLFVAARVPTHRLAAGMADQGALALDLWIMTADGRLVRRDSSRWGLDATARRGSAVRAWRHRLPRERYLHRVEAFEPVEARGARGASMPASLDDASFTLGGFGVSQVLVTQALASRSPGAPGERWSDFIIVPNPGDLHRNRSVSLLWEVYGDSTTALDRYRIEVTLQPPSPGVLRSLGVQARTGIVGGAGRRARERDRVAVTWTREHPGVASVRVEQVELGAVKVSPGTYVLRVDVTDAATGRVATTSRLVTVR